MKLNGIMNRQTNFGDEIVFVFKIRCRQTDFEYEKVYFAKDVVDFGKSEAITAFLFCTSVFGTPCSISMLILISFVRPLADSIDS